MQLAVDLAVLVVTQRAAMATEIEKKRHPFRRYPNCPVGFVGAAEAAFLSAALDPSCPSHF